MFEVLCAALKPIKRYSQDDHRLRSCRIWFIILQLFRVTPRVPKSNDATFEGIFLIEIFDVKYSFNNPFSDLANPARRFFIF